MIPRGPFQAPTFCDSVGYTVHSPLVSDKRDYWAGQKKGPEIDTHMRSGKIDQWDKNIFS